MASQSAVTQKEPALHPVFSRVCFSFFKCVWTFYSPQVPLAYRQQWYKFFSKCFPTKLPSACQWASLVWMRGGSATHFQLRSCAQESQSFQEAPNENSAAGGSLYHLLSSSFLSQRQTQWQLGSSHRQGHHNGGMTRHKQLGLWWLLWASYHSWTTHQLI